MSRTNFVKNRIFSLEMAREMHAKHDRTPFFKKESSRMISIPFQGGRLSPATFDRFARHGHRKGDCRKLASNTF